MIEPADIRLFSDVEQKKTQSGQVYREFENEEDIAINLQLAKRLKPSASSFGSDKQWLWPRCGSTGRRRHGPYSPRPVLKQLGAGGQLVFQQPDGMPVPALVFRPPNHGNRRMDAVIIADGRGMKRVAESTLVREFLNENGGVHRGPARVR